MTSTGHPLYLNCHNDCSCHFSDDHHIVNLRSHIKQSWVQNLEVRYALLHLIVQYREQHVGSKLCTTSYLEHPHKATPQKSLSTVPQWTWESRSLSLHYHVGTSRGLPRAKHTIHASQRKQDEPLITPDIPSTHASLTNRIQQSIRTAHAKHSAKSLNDCHHSRCQDATKQSVEKHVFSSAKHFPATAWYGDLIGDETWNDICAFLYAVNADCGWIIRR